MVELPINIADISFSAYEDFKANEEKYLAANKQEEDPTVGIGHLQKALSFIVGEGVYDLPVYFSEKDFTESVIVGQPLSVFRCYNWIVNLERFYKPLLLDINYEHVYKGEKYQIEGWKAVKFTESMGSFYLDETLAGLTALEMIELLEFEQAKQNVKGKDEDHTFSFTFTLRQIAVILRKPNEELPSDKGERDAFLDRRMKHFEELDLQTVKDVRFFLIYHFQRSLETALHKAFSSLTSQKQVNKVNEIRKLTLLLIRLAQSWGHTDISQLYNLLIQIDGSKLKPRKPSLQLR